MGCVQLALAAVALAGEPASGCVMLEARMTTVDPVTGLGQVVSEPKALTQSGRTVTFRVGGSRRVSDEDGFERPVDIGLLVELRPVVRRTPQGQVLAVACNLTHRIAVSSGFTERFAQTATEFPLARSHTLRLPGDGRFAPLTVTFTARVVDAAEADAPTGRAAR